MTPLDWVLALFVAYRLTRLASEDFPPVKAVRDWLLRRWPGPDAEFPIDEVEVVEGERGDEYRHKDTGIALVEHDLVFFAERPRALGQLIECYWCHGFWISGLALAVLWQPSWWELLVGALALNGAVGLLRGWEK